MTRPGRTRSLTRERGKFKITNYQNSKPSNEWILQLFQFGLFKTLVNKICNNLHLSAISNNNKLLMKMCQKQITISTTLMISLIICKNVKKLQLHDEVNYNIYEIKCKQPNIKLCSISEIR